MVLLDVTYDLEPESSGLGPEILGSFWALRSVLWLIMIMIILLKLLITDHSKTVLLFTLLFK